MSTVYLCVFFLQVIVINNPFMFNFGVILPWCVDNLTDFEDLDWLSVLIPCLFWKCVTSVSTFYHFLEPFIQLLKHISICLTTVWLVLQ